MTKINIVNHTHWDREWYFSTMDALLLSDQVFEDVLIELEENIDARFCLDGQASIIEDYLSIRPERLPQIKKLVEEGRLLIGPWYTQTDAQLVCGESILRNLSIGIHEINKIGKHMEVGYLPDTFGFNAQMPTILRNCNIDNIIFWRGINLGKHVKSPYFKWKGLGNEEVYAANLIDGYGSIPRLFTNEEFLNNKLFKLADKIKSMTDLDEILIPIGNDQVEITCNIKNKIDEINKISNDEYVQSTYLDFIDYIRKNSEKLERYEGEFREPKTGRVHKTIGSVRYDIKKTNFDMEQNLLKRVEPLYAIAESLGIKISKNLITTAWKKIMEGQAHDGMAGCITDDVANDVLYRMKQAREIADGIENLVKKRIAEGLRLSKDEILVFNTLAYKYDGYKVVEFLSSTKDKFVADVEKCTVLDIHEYEGKENILIEAPEGNYFINEDGYYKITALIKTTLPAMGYKVFKLSEGKVDIIENSNNLEIKNDNYKIFVENEKLCVELKDGRKIEDFITFENCGNDGDTYDFSPLRGDSNITFRIVEGIRKASEGIEKLELSGRVLLPKDLESRLDRNELKPLDIKLIISLLKDDELINCRIIVDNNILSHRLRACIKSDILSNESIASIPFGYIKRPILNGEIGEWNSSYLEIPIDIEVFEGTVSITDDKNTLSIYSKGIKEYQVIEDRMYLTLLSTTSQLGKPNLLYRPGRASGDTTKQGHVMIATPNAEQLGKNEFEFSISLLEESFNENKVEKRYEKVNSQNIFYQLQGLNKFINRLDNKIQNSRTKLDLKREYSLLEVDKNICISSISASFKDNAILLRMKNCSNEELIVDRYDFNKFKRWEIVNAIEEVQDNPKLVIDPYNIITIKLYF
ncbi:MAG: glycoside hydrolase family 38 C-terminal domain-containing protein [Clostridium sp.]|uniref:glycoside hydrolase family 38 N-terminal domain-containing protein n=1 Tax=Clostridium sp. TaxID=1506 RepID=UPI00290EC014|nr:glycoside hydrolase family 38 C-terminal domain-containing protein [Clostridium sp.]MDU5110690.1 glycoside hydrolase family 38 C-terminal domain-containing protein [Clostridium sp.]